MTIDASILLVTEDAAVLRAQLDSLAAAHLTERHEIVVVTDGEVPAPGGLTARFARLRSGAQGRRAAYQLAASAARGQIGIALASIVGTFRMRNITTFGFLATIRIDSLNWLTAPKNSEP